MIMPNTWFLNLQAYKMFRKYIFADMLQFES